MPKLNAIGWARFLRRFAADFYKFSGYGSIPAFLYYEIDQPLLETRKQAYLSLSAPLQKLAFDTRRIDQNQERMPRENLQYWHRSQEFIDPELKKKIEALANLLNPLQELEDGLGNQQEWLTSYAKNLKEAVERVLRIKEADGDIFNNQINYLEQLLFTRYRLDLEALEKFNDKTLKKIILALDEPLLKKGAYLLTTSSPKLKQNTEQSLPNKIVLGNGEKNITITLEIKL